MDILFFLATILNIITWGIVICGYWALGVFFGWGPMTDPQIKAVLVLSSIIWFFIFVAAWITWQVQENKK